MPELYPTFDVPVMIDDTPEVSHQQRYSAAFDFDQGDFVQTGSGAVLKASPYEAWKAWCMKTAYTQRWTLYGYSDAYGIEWEEALAQVGRAAQESTLARTLNEALMADPYGRTTYVRDFIFDWQSDGVMVTFAVGSIWDEEAELKVQL